MQSSRTKSKVGFPVELLAQPTNKISVKSDNLQLVRSERISPSIRSLGRTFTINFSLPNSLAF